MREAPLTLIALKAIDPTQASNGTCKSCLSLCNEQPTKLLGFAFSIVSVGQEFGHS